MKIAIKMFLLNMYRTDAAFCCPSITHSMCFVYLKCQEAGHEPVAFTSLPVHNQQLKKNLLTVTSNVRLTFFGIKGVLLSSFGSNAFSMTTKTALWYILTQSKKKSRPPSSHTQANSESFLLFWLNLQGTTYVPKLKLKFHFNAMF